MNKIKLIDIPNTERDKNHTQTVEADHRKDLEVGRKAK
jgi:hypothetical protein